MDDYEYALVQEIQRVNSEWRDERTRAGAITALTWAIETYATYQEAEKR